MGPLFIFVLATLSSAQNVQSWNEVDLAASWRKVDFLVPMLARTDTHLPNPQLAAIGITVDSPRLWRLTLTGGYLFGDLPQRSEVVHIPLLAVSISFRPGRLTITDRDRFEKLVGYGTSPIRYRNRLLLSRSFGVDEWGHLFVDDEVFFDLSASSWSQNRFQAGGGTRVNDRISFDVYYLERNSSHGPATTVVGTTLRMTLTKVREHKP
jgi:hypothetical protein